MKSVLPTLILLLGMSLSCTFLKDKPTSKAPSDEPKIDFITPAKGIDVKVQLDNKTASEKIGKSGGSLTLTGTDGSTFTLDVPTNALDSETTITMTAVKTIDGTSMDKNTPVAVQLEPSGLFFNQFATLTITPAIEIPIKEQIIFGYEGEGKDYHLALIDPKSKEIKIKLMQFSGAGVGIGSDKAWAANLSIQASTASTRLSQKLAEASNEIRQRVLLGDAAAESEWAPKMKSILDQYEDQVVLKGMVAADLDCKHGWQALHDLIFLERSRQLFGLESSPRFADDNLKLLKIIKECKKAYTASGGGMGMVVSGRVEDISRSFTLDGKFPGGTATFNYSPESEKDGLVTYMGSGGGATISGNGKYTVSGTEGEPLTLNVTLTGCANVGGCRTTYEVITLTPVK